MSLNTCASIRDRGDGDVAKCLLNMERAVDQMRGGFTNLEQKVDTIFLDVSSIREQLLGSHSMDSPSLTELNGLLRKSIDRGLLEANTQALLDTKPATSRNDTDQLAVIKDSLKTLGMADDEMKQSLKRLEQGLGGLAARDKDSKVLPCMPEGQENNVALTGGQTQPSLQDKGIAGDAASGVDFRMQLREELQAFQTALSKEITMLGKERTIDIEIDPDAMMNRGTQKDPGGANDFKFGTLANDLPTSAPDTTQVAESSGNGKQVESQELLQQTKKEDKSEADKVQQRIQELTAMEAQETEDQDPKAGESLVLVETGSLGAVFGNDGDVENPQYNVEDFYYTEGCSQRVARSTFFANSTIVVVIFNAIYIGVDSDHNHKQNIYEADWPFQVCSQFFCVFFTYELLTRFLAFSKKPDCLKDGWFKFDAFLVSTMILDTWLLMPILYYVGGGVQIPTQPLRMLRLFKLTRMARLMKAFPELVIMIKGLVRSLRAISSSMILIGLMVYVWGIMMHMLMKDEKEFNTRLWDSSMHSFDTLTKCIWTLLMAGTLMLDNAGNTMTELLFSDHFNYQMAGFFFVLYCMLSALLILQQLIGVLCDVVSRVGAEQRDATAIGFVKQELLADLLQYDGGDGMISQEELFTVMRNKKSRALLQKLNINRPFLLELQKMMFIKPGQQVSIKSILELLVMCRGDNVCTVESMAGGLLSIIHQVVAVQQTLQTYVHTELIAIKSALHKDIAVLDKDVHLLKENSMPR